MGIYEHPLLGRKISTISSLNLDLPFIEKVNVICLYENGIILLDKNRIENYILSLEDFSVKYIEKICNLKRMSDSTLKILNYDTIDYKKIRNVKNLKFYGKLTIDIKDIGKIILNDNKSLKMMDFYIKICNLKGGTNPLEYRKEESRSSILRRIKSNNAKVIKLVPLIFGVLFILCLRNLYGLINSYDSISRIVFLVIILSLILIGMIFSIRLLLRGNNKNKL